MPQVAAQRHVEGVRQGSDASELTHSADASHVGLEVACDPTFEEFLSRKALPFRKEWRCSWNLEQLGKSVDVTVVKLENFYEDLRHVKHVSRHIARVGHVNKRKDIGPGWQETITSARAEQIQRLWPEDFVRFGYTREVDT